MSKSPKNPLRQFRRGMLPGLLALFVGLLTIDCPAWETVKFDGHDYVTLESVREFYHFDKLVRDDDSVTLENKSVVMKLRLSRRDCFMNNVKFVLSRKIAEDDGKLLISRLDLAKLLDPTLRPNFIKDAGDFRTVILDPGHGGEDPGISNELGNEAGYTLLLANKIKPLLEERGFRVVMTRDKDSDMTAGQRIAFANQVEESCIFLSLHFSEGPPAERGVRTFRLAAIGVPHFNRGLLKSDFEERTGNSRDPSNAALAVAVHGGALNRLGSNTFDRGVQYARFAELIDLEHPAIRFEGGFMSHPDEATPIHSEAYQNALARGITDAILKYRHAAGAKKPD